MKTICGADCSKCSMKETCKGCVKTEGHPFGGTCVVATCCQNREYQYCSDCTETVCQCKAQLIQEFNALGIEDMSRVTELYSLQGSFINLEYPLPGGQRVKFWKDNDIYLGTQLPKNNSDRCYGLTANEEYLLVCEYGENGADRQIVAFKKR